MEPDNRILFCVALKHGSTGDKRVKTTFLGSVSAWKKVYILENIDSSNHDDNHQRLVEERILVLSIRCLGRAENLPF